MARKINDYALIGDCETAALVAADGTIDFLCWPRFHSEACLAGIIGDDDNGIWRLRPPSGWTATRRYRGDTAILETRFETESGAATVTDFMPVRSEEEGDRRSTLVRIVTGERGSVRFDMALVLRFDYGRLVPWVIEDEKNTVEFFCGPHVVSLHTSVVTTQTHARCNSEFSVSAGEQKSFVLHYRRSHRERPPQLDAKETLQETERWWRDWTKTCTYRGQAREAVLRSLITIKLMASRQTGGIVAAPTTSLPEKIGGERNWDYRFCWLRDASFTLLALLHSGFKKEAAAWRDWLLRAIAGMPREVQPFYSVAGEHRAPEWEIPWLAGFRDSRPVRAGNAAYEQFQLDVYGEIIDLLHLSREHGIPPDDWSWRLQQELVEHVERIWREADAGFWEVRHGREHFTQSRVMAWVAVDRAIRAAEKYELSWPVDRWRKLRQDIHREVCEKGYDERIGGFVRSYQTREPDAANLLIPIVGFLPANDPRVLRTVELIERKLIIDDFVMRYDTERAEDGLPVGEGVFLACSFWYADNLLMQGRSQEARRVFNHMLAVRNDVGLLSEEYDPRSGEMLGNFPQVLSHLSLINTAHNLAQGYGPAHVRAGQAEKDKVPAG